MSKVQTAAEIAEKILKEAKRSSYASASDSKLKVEFDEAEFKAFTKAILEMWAEEIQSQPNGGNEDLTLAYMTGFEKGKEEGEAKCAEAWRMGAEAMRKLTKLEMEKLLTNYEGKTYGYHCDKALNAFRTLPLPEYQGKK